MTKQTAGLSTTSAGDATTKAKRPRHVLAASTPHAEWRVLVPLIGQAGGRIASDDIVQRWLGSPGASGNDQQQAIRGVAQEFESSKPGATVLLPLGSTINEQLLGAWTAEFDDTLMVLFHTRPETAMAKAMEEGSDPAAALSEWQTAARHLLHVHRHNRGRSRVIDVERARKAPDEFIRACRDHLSLEPEQARARAGISSELTNAEPVYSLIAAQVVAQTPEVQSLADELEASSLPMGSPAGPAMVDCQAVYQRFLELKNQGEYKELEQENELLLLQLHQVQEELESYYRECRQCEKKIADMRGSLSWKLTMPLRVFKRLITGRPLRGTKKA